MVTHVAPLHLTLARFAIAGSIFLPWVVRSRHAWGAGLELGGWLFLGYATQAVGLRYTTASRSAFITAASVVLVPLLITAAGRRVPRSVSVAALVALAGVGLLSWDGSPPNVGDAWTLVTAAAYAVYVVRLEAHALAVDTRRLTAVQLWSVAMFAALGVLAGRAVGGPSAVGAPPAIPPSAWAAVAYLALAATAVTTWLQAAGQRRVTAPEAALIYTLEPLWAALFAYWWLGESLGRRGLAGAALVVAAMLLSQWPIRRP